MAHPSRAKWAEELSKQLKAKIVWDQKNDVWDTCKRAWQAHEMTADWAITIQDDAIVAKDFRKRSKEHLKRASDLGCAVQFYAGSGRLDTQFAQSYPQGYYVDEFLSWGVAIAIKPALIPPMIRFGNSYPAWQDDIKIKYFLKSRRIKTYYPLPCLVDHRRMAENATLTGCKDSDRYSNYYKG